MRKYILNQGSNFTKQLLIWDANCMNCSDVKNSIPHPQEILQWPLQYISSLPSLIQSETITAYYKNLSILFFLNCSTARENIFRPPHINMNKVETNWQNLNLLPFMNTDCFKYTTLQFKQKTLTLYCIILCYKIRQHIIHRPTKINVNIPT